MIKIELDVRTAAAVRESLFRDTKDYTYDPTCCPQRVVDIRNVIVDLDTQIEAEIQKVIEAQTEETSNETTDA
mgnify:FL=1|tara:strand:- start:261 stop:479 length:219 start_codon:yes stop_codon:yes gene_type:complete